MKTWVTALLIVCCLWKPGYSAPLNVVFAIELRAPRGMQTRVLDLTFEKEVPPPDIVDEILREALNLAILMDPAKGILATAWQGDERLTGKQYSGYLLTSR